MFSICVWLARKREGESEKASHGLPVVVRGASVAGSSLCSQCAKLAGPELLGILLSLSLLGGAVKAEIIR